MPPKVARRAVLLEVDEPQRDPLDLAVDERHLVGVVSGPDIALPASEVKARSPNSLLLAHAGQAGEKRQPTLVVAAWKDRPGKRRTGGTAPVRLDLLASAPNGRHGRGADAPP